MEQEPRNKNHGTKAVGGWQPVTMATPTEAPKLFFSPKSYFWANLLPAADSAEVADKGSECVVEHLV